MSNSYYPPSTYPRLIKSPPIAMQMKPFLAPTLTNIINLSFECPFHPKENARRVCNSRDCSKRMLLCEECLIEDPDHLAKHRSNIVFLHDFLQKAVDNSQNSQKSRRLTNNNRLFPDDNSNKEVIFNLEGNLSQIKNHIERQKYKINTDIELFLNNIKLNLYEIRQNLYNDLDDYYNTIVKDVQDVHLNYTGNYNDNDNVLENLTLPNLISKLNNLRDGNIINNYLRKLRDGSSGSTTISAEKSNSLLIQQKILEKLTKVFENPPDYKESDYSQKIYNTLLNKIPVFISDFYIQMKDMLSFMFLEESKKCYESVVSKDNKSCMGLEGTNFNLSLQSTIKVTPHKQLNCITIIEDDKIASGGSDGQIMLWNINTNEHISTFQGHKGSILSLSTITLKEKQGEIETSNLFLVSGSSDKNVLLWNMNDENDTIALKGHDDSITSILDILDGRNLVTGSIDRKIIVWDIAKGKISNILPCNGSIYSLHLLRDGNRFVSVDYSGAINIWKIEYQRNNGINNIVKIINERVIISKSKIICLNSAYINNNILVSGGDDHCIRLWNLSNGKEMKSFRFDGEICDLVLLENSSSNNNNSKFLIVCLVKNNNMIYLVDSNGEKRNIKIDSFMINNVFSFHKLQIHRTQDGQIRILAANQNENDKTIYVLRLENFKEKN